MALTKLSKSENWNTAPVKTILYGGPGVGKSTLANTAFKPVMFDIEKGADRAVQGDAVWRIDNYEDMDVALADPDLKKYQTIIIDTADAFCQLIIDYIVKNKARWPDAVLKGNEYVLSQQGYTQLGRMFRLFFEKIDSLGLDLIFIAHVKPANSNEKMRPYTTGNITYRALTQSMTLIGLVTRTQVDYFVDFTVNDKFETKDSGALGCVRIGNLDPNLGKVQMIMANIIESTRQRLKNTASAGKNVNAFLSEIENKIKNAKTAKDVNDLVLESQVWDLAYQKEGKIKIHKAATLLGLFWDSDLNGYRSAVPTESITPAEKELESGDDQNRKIAAFIDTIAGIDVKMGNKLIERFKKPMNADEAETAIKFMQDWILAAKQNQNAN